MRALSSLATITLVASLMAAFSPNLLAAEKCCECGYEYKLKKIYRPVVTFKEIPVKHWDYKTVCQKVLFPTLGCKSCGCDAHGCPGKPHHMCVPVAVPRGCSTCYRKVPVVTWIVECRCEKCCKKCKHHHHCKIR